ncbi:MAG: tetratricopeptide repeat protein [Oceanihabitans sp.]
MNRKNLSILILAIACCCQVFGQQTAVYTNSLVDYQKALSLYNNQQYLAAQSMFFQLQKEAKTNVLQADCAFYIANCAVRLNQQNADKLVEQFVANYPTSTKRNTAFVDVANYYFTNGKYAYAKKWYDKVDENSLARTEKEQYNFNNGYVAFATKDYKEAKNYLSRVENSQKYGSQAKYYIGFMAYQNDDYNKANTYFDQVKEEDKYKEKLSYYQADLHFKLGKFEEAITLAKEQIATSDKNEVSQLNKIIGESYFNLKKYSEAIPFLTKYLGERGKWNNTDYYQLGYAYYKQKDYLKAINEFNKIVGGNNLVAQNAYYHLGESYINLNKKPEALNAFRNASEMDYELKIQEDAWLNYAKISYEIGNSYQSVPQVITAYLEAYPNSSFKEEMETLLIDSYITSKNYKEALKLLKGKNSYDNKIAYQKVVFYRGLELYNESNYLEAMQLFKKSLSESHDAIFTARATFWKAETNYNLTNYNEALLDFKQFEQQLNANETPEFTNISYNLAYTYFKQKNYAQAIVYFQQFIENNSKDNLRINDAYLRKADAYFVSSKYNEAIKAYTQAVKIGEIETDYAYFQKALSYGYAGDSKKKITELESFISNYKSSKLQDDALYNLGNEYVKNGEIEKAMQNYNSLNTNYSSSKFVPKVLLRQGLVYYNASENDKALTKFKKVAADFPGSPEANQAVATARLIYIDIGEVAAYANWVETLDYIEVTNVDLDNTTYQAAEKKYLDSKTKEAIQLFNSYLNQFPNGLHAIQSHFYLAQLYFKEDLKENAAPHYKTVTEALQNEFTEESLLRLAQINTEQKKWEEALPVLKRLENEASFPQNIIFAQSNLMKAFFELQNYKDAVVYAEKVYQHTNLDNKLKSDAQVIIARSSMQTGDELKAQKAYAQLELTAIGETAAEALYYNAYFKNKEAKYKASNVVTQQLAKDYSSYKYYSAKGLVLMAKNYYALNDAFQATYILESVIKNFTSFTDIVTQAETELNKIKAEQAKTNASIISED